MEDFDSYYNLIEDYKTNSNNLSKIDQITSDALNLDLKYSQNNLSLHDGLCSNCNKSNFVDDFVTGDIICYECGIIQDKLIDQSPEWNNYQLTGFKKDQNRCGTEYNQFNNYFPKSSLSTVIHSNKKFSKLHQWMSMPNAERSLYKIFKYIDFLCDSNDINSVITNYIKSLYKTLIDNRDKVHHKMTKQQELLGACFYYAFENNNQIRSYFEISNITGIDDSKIKSGCKLFLDIRFPNRAFNNNNSNNPNNNTISPNDFIHRYSNKLKLPTDLIDIILRLANNVILLGCVKNNTPTSIAVACIHYVMISYNIDLPKEKLQEYFDVSGGTIDKICKKFEKFGDIIINEDLTKLK